MDSHTCPGPMSGYMVYVNACGQYGIDPVPFLDRMIVLDYIMENYGRHPGNFGLIRNSDTPEFVSPAPVFDTGSSPRCNRMLWGDWDSEPKCVPFEETFDRQLKPVKNFDWIDYSKLYRSLDAAEDLLKGGPADKLGLASQIVELLDRRITSLKKHALG